MTKQDYPFAAMVGLRRPRHALKLLAVDPWLKGLLIASPPGTGKTLLAHSLRSILPESKLGPGHSPGLQMAVRGRTVKNSALAYAAAAAPIVDVPIGVTEDMLLGGIDFVSTLTEGSKRASSGLLARANGGFICVDHIDLLDSTNLRHLLTALDSGYVSIERDGISSRPQAQFAVIGTLEAWTGAAPALKDRVGLIVEQYESPSDSERGEIVDRAEKFLRDPVRFCKEFAVETTEVCLEVFIARSRLSSVTIDRRYISRISAAAIDLGIESSRADLFAVRAARASAALRGSAQVAETDLIAAIDYVLLPRAGSYDERQRVASQALTSGDVDRLEDLPRGAGFQGFQCARSKAERCGNEQGREDNRDEVILQPQDCGVPGELADSSPVQRGYRGKARATSGRRSEKIGSSHGRYIGAVPAAGSQNHGKRIAVDATLRAAAPHQKLRRAAADGSGKVQEDNRRVIVKPNDLRLKRLKHRTGMLFIFLVDTSGSMALGRIGHAKGVMLRLLRQAYLHRDDVALIAFRGASTEVVLEPTSSVEQARRAIESMPAGGGTPLAAGLAGAIALVERAHKKMPRETMLLVFTDGRVNVALKSTGGSGRTKRDLIIKAELEEMGRRLTHHGIKAVVIDTGSWGVKDGRCASISATIGARYCRLPKSGPDGLYRQIREFAADSSMR